MVKNSTRFILAAALLLTFNSISAQTEPVYVQGESHIIDIREFTANLDWESPQVRSRIETRATPAPDDIRWIDRIRNLPDYMRTFYDRHGVLVQQVLDGGTNYLCDPDADNTNAIHLGKDNTCLILKEVTRKIQYTFPDDVEYSDPYAKQDYAEQAVNDDVAANQELLMGDVYTFLPYMFMSMSYDFPQAFWLGNYWSWGSSYSYSWDYIHEKGRDSVQYTFYVLYNVKTGSFDSRIDQFRTAQAVKDGVKEYKALVKDILDNNPNTTRYAQVRYLNDWLTKHNAYSSAYGSGEFSPIVWSPISALRGTSGDEGPVCEGYARAFKILCDGLNIPCMLAVGDAFSYIGATPESHMWNEVKMNDGQWYAVDVTWNDPLTDDPVQQKVSGAENEKWLLLGRNDIVSTYPSDLTFSESHPNSLVYGQTESAQWDYDSETLIADTGFDIANGVEQPAQTGSVTVYSILGVKMGTYPSIEDASTHLDRGIYIINGKKVSITY